MKHLLLLSLTLFFVSCHEDEELDTWPPAAPRGITSLSLDNAIQLNWLHNTEPDVAGYNVWKSDRYDGRYILLGSTTENEFTDHSAQNGVTLYYAVSAYDFNENESELSTDVLYDTPRPEGFGVQLQEFSAQPLLAGYDFSTYSVGPYNDQYTDLFFERVGDLYLLSVWDDTDIQDMGFTSSFDDISWAPVEGWAPSRTAEAIAGHTYIVWTWDNHYAKVRVLSVDAAEIVFDWAYQTAEGNTELRVVKPVPRKRPPVMRTGELAASK